MTTFQNSWLIFSYSSATNKGIKIYVVSKKLPVILIEVHACLLFLSKWNSFSFRFIFGNVPNAKEEKYFMNVFLHEQLR